MEKSHVANHKEHKTSTNSICYFAPTNRESR